MADYTQFGKDATKGIYKDVNDLLNGDATKTTIYKIVSDEKDPLQKDVAEALNSKLDALNRKIDEMSIDRAIEGLTYDDLIEAAFDESDIEGSEAVDDDGDVEVISTEADEDLDDEDEDVDDSSEMGTITVDLPDDVDPSDVTVNIDGDEYSADDDELDVNTDEDIDAPEITVDLPDHVDPSDVSVNIDGDNYIIDPNSIDDDIEDDDEEAADDVVESFLRRSGKYSYLFESDEGMDDDDEYADDEEDDYIGDEDADEDDYIGDEDADDGDLDDDEEVPEEGDDLDEDDVEEDDDLEETVKLLNHHLYFNGSLYEGDEGVDDEGYDDEDVDDEDYDDEDDADVDDEDIDDDEDYDDADVDDEDIDDEDVDDEDADEIEEAINVLRRHGLISESDGDFDMEPGDMSDTAADALDDVRDAMESEDEIIIDDGDGGADNDGTIDTVSDPVNESEVAPVSSNGKNADEMQGDKLTDDEDADEDDDSYEDDESDEDVDDDDDSYEDEEPDEDAEVQAAEAVDILLDKYLGRKVSLDESAFVADYLVDRYLGECKGKGCKGKKKAKKLIKGKKGRRKVSEGNYGLNAGLTIDTAGWNPYHTNTYLNSDKYFSRDGSTTKISAGNSRSNAMSGVTEGMANRFTIYTDDLNQAIKPLAEVVTTRNNLPLAENVSNWNASKASAYIRKNAWKNPARANLALMRATHLYFVNEGTKPEDYQFPIATVIRGKVYAVPQAIEEAAALFASPIYTKKFNESTLTAIRNVIDFYMNKMGKRTAWQEGTCVNINEGTNLTMLIRKSVYDPYKIAEMEYIKDKERQAQKLLRD